MTDHVGKAMRRLAAVYGEPQTEYKSELLAEFVSALGKFRADVLTAGVDRVIRERHFPTWPTVGEVVKACREVADEMADKYAPQPATAPQRYEPVDQKTAAELLAKAHAGLDSRNNFEGITRRARAWARAHGCSVMVNVGADWGEEAVDQHGQLVPIGWQP